MATVVICTWLPRSPQHLHEVTGLLENLDLGITDIKLNQNLTFKVKTSQGLMSARFTPYGIFSFSFPLDETQIPDTISKFPNYMKDFFHEKFLKKIQPITYQQIQKGMLPSTFHTVIFSEKSQPEKFRSIKCNGITAYYDQAGKYSPDSELYITGDVSEETMEIANLYSYTVLASNYLSQMVSKFSKIYAQMADVEKLIEVENFDVLKKIMKSTDEVKKQSAENYGKLIQALNNLKHTKEHMQEKIQKESHKLVCEKIGLNSAFKRLEYDYDYVMPLWNDVLIKNIENLDFMVNARFELQESVETRKEEKEMKLLQGIFLVGVIASILALGAMPGASITLYSPEGVLLASGNLVSFKIQDLLSFGVLAIIVSIGFFIIFNYIYMNFGKIKKNTGDKK